MASLSGNKIKDTYESLIKFNDNGAADGTLQVLSDGAGNSIGISVDTSGNISSSAVGTLIGTSSSNVVNATLLDVSGNGTSGQYLISDGDGSFSWTDGVAGDIEGVTAGDGLSGGGTSGTVSLAVNVDDSTIEINSDTVRVKDDGISYEKVDAEFTTSSALTAGATVNVDFDAAQVFTLTPNANTTFNITNPKIGVTKSIIVTGAGSSYTADTWTVGGGAGTFNRIAGTYDDTSSTKNFYQITCVSATEFWYSISQIAS